MVNNIIEEMNNTKKIIIIAGLLIGLLIIFGVVAFWYYGKPHLLRKIDTEKKEMTVNSSSSVNYAPPTIDCSKADSLDKADECYFSSAISSSTSNDCDKIKSETNAALCHDTFVLTTAKNITDCQKILKPIILEQCKQRIFTSYDSISACTEQSCRDLVLHNQAIETSKSETCQAIKNINLKKDCVNAVKSLPTDTDGDGLSDSIEMANGFNYIKADTDGDGINDGDEINKYQTNPVLADSDNDGLSDGLEINRYGTDPKNADSDNDGNLDGNEVKSGYNPCGEGAMPGDDLLKILCQKLKNK